jgi:hypothetical protein
VTIDSPYLPPDELARELEKALEASIAVSRSRAQTPATPKPRAGEHVPQPPNACGQCGQIGGEHLAHCLLAEQL